MQRKLGSVVVSKALCRPHFVIVFTQLLLLFARPLAVKFCCLHNLAVSSLVIFQGFVRLLSVRHIQSVSSSLNFFLFFHTGSSNSNLFFSCRSKSLHILASDSFSVMNLHLLFAFFFSALREFNMGANNFLVRPYVKYVVSSAIS